MHATAFPMSARGVYPTALYSCCRHSTVIALSQLASTCPLAADGTGIVAASTEESTDAAGEAEERRSDVLRSRKREKRVVGWTSSMCSCRSAGTLYEVVRMSVSPLSCSQTWYF